MYIHNVVYVGPASAADLCFCLTFIMYISAGLIWSTGLDSRHNLVAESKSRKLIWLFLTFLRFLRYGYWCLIENSCIWTY